MQPRLVVQDRRMVDRESRRIRIPVAKTRFLAPAVRALLEDLRADREDVVAAKRKKLRERARIERHVVVEEERPVLAHVVHAELNRAAEAQGRVGMDKLDLRKA